MSLAVRADPGEENEQVNTSGNRNQFEVMENSDEQIPKESDDEMDTNNNDITEVESDQETKDEAKSVNDEGSFHVFIFPLL